MVDFYYIILYNLIKFMCWYAHKRKVRYFIFVELANSIKKVCDWCELRKYDW